MQMTSITAAQLIAGSNIWLIGFMGALLLSSLRSPLINLSKVVDGVDHGRLVEIAALYNPTETAWKLRGLDVTVTTHKPMRKMIAAKRFISRPILLPKRTIYFIRLEFSSYRGIPTLYNQDDYDLLQLVGIATN